MNIFQKLTVFTAIFAVLVISMMPGSAHARERMTAAEITTLISDHTAKWSKGAGYYDPNGTLKIIWEGRKLSGVWRVKDEDGGGGLFCMTVQEWWKNNEKCRWRYFRDGNNIVVYDWSNKKESSRPLSDFSQGNNL